MRLNADNLATIRAALAQGQVIPAEVIEKLCDEIESLWRELEEAVDTDLHRECEG